MQGANLSDADLQEADLTAAHLQGANLIQTRLQAARLPGADLRGANLSYAVFGKTNLENGNLTSILANDITARLGGSADLDYSLNSSPTIPSLEAAAKGVTPYARAAVISKALCREKEGHFAIQGVIGGRLELGNSIADLSAATLQAHVQDVENCPAARGLTHDDKRRLVEAVIEQHQDWLLVEADEWFYRAGLRADVGI